MLLSYNWLKEFLPDLSLSAAEVAERLTLHAFETEVVGSIALDDNVTVATITKIESHPNADRLTLATVDTGSAKVTVVCGAPNISVGDVVPFSSPGTKLRDETGASMTLRAATIRGVKSPGMLNSPRELGLSDWHGGIYLLPADTPVGSKLNEHIPDDTILDAELTPNRAHDCYSHRGVARELAALVEMDITEPELKPPTVEPLSGWELSIESADDTPAYYGTYLDGVQIGPSPLWLHARLWAVGAKPINNVVDVTNYVMFELGNPTHTFDAATLRHKHIGVRRARDGEKLMTLDDESHQLITDNLLITDGDEPVALAGVMGGKETGVTDTTTGVFLEVANFNHYTVFKSAQAVKSITEGSARWAKGVPVSFAHEASVRTINLLQELTGASVVGELSSEPSPVVPREIYFTPGQVAKLAGKEFSDKTIQNTLERVRCNVVTDDPQWVVTPPPDRLDLTGAHDLIEEVVRLTGLETIEPTMSTENQQSLPDQMQWREIIRRLLVSEGFTETTNYSFEDSFALRVADSAIDVATAIEVSNPVSPDQKYLRQSLIPRLLQQVLVNKGDLTRRAGASEDALFEIGTVFHRGDGGRVEGIVEEEQLAGVLVGPRATVEYIDVVLHTISKTLGLKQSIDDDVSLTVLPQPSRLRSKMSLPIAYFSLPLTTLIDKATTTPDYVPQLADEATQYEAVSAYPPSYRDVSLLVQADVSVEQVQDVLDRAGGELLIDVDLFDEWQPADSVKKSLAFHLTYQAMDRTLSDDEVSELHNGVIQTLKDELAAELRE